MHNSPLSQRSSEATWRVPLGHRHLLPALERLPGSVEFGQAPAANLVLVGQFPWTVRDPLVALLPAHTRSQ